MLSRANTQTHAIFKQVWRIGSGVYPEFAFLHITKCSWGSLHGRVDNSNKSSALFRWEVEQPGATGRGRRWRINSAADIMWFSWQHTDIGVGHFPTNSLRHLRWCLLRVWHRFYTGRYWFSFSFLHFCIRCCGWGVRAVNQKVSGSNPGSCRSIPWARCWTLNGPS